MNIIIKFTFTNDKGIEKTVSFPFDSNYYKDLHHPSVSKEQRDEILLSYYREYCDEHNRKKHEVQMMVDDEGYEIEKADDSPTVLELMIEDEETNARNSLINRLIQILTLKQRKAIELVFFKSMKQEDAAKLMNISQPAIHKLISTALNRMKKEI